MLQLLTGGATCACCVWPLAASSKRRTAFTCDATTVAGRPVRAGWRPSAQQPEVELVIAHANVVDTLRGDLREDVSVLVGGGRILAVEEGARSDAHPGAERVDARGHFVTPGYNDMHSHVLELEEPSGALALMLAEGVTGFRQMSGSPERLAERRAGRLPIGEVAPALLEIPGTVLTPMNAATSEAAAAEVRRQKSEGADFIKVGFISPAAFDTVMRTARDEGVAVLGHLQDGVDVTGAVKAGFRCVEHLGPDPNVWIACSTEEEALRAQAGSGPIRTLPVKIPFLMRLIQRRVQLMLINPRAFSPPSLAERTWRAVETFDDAKFRALAARFRAEDTWHCPTLVRLRTQELADAPEYQNHPDLKYMPDDHIKRWRKVTKRFAKLPSKTRRIYSDLYPRQLKLAKSLSDQGVRMIAGTDGGWLSGPGLTLQEEFAELAKAGFSPLQVLQMTTINAAEYLGRELRMGRVEPGCAADLVVLKKDPREDVANLGDIEAVVRDGRCYSREKLDVMRHKVEQNRGHLS